MKLGAVLPPSVSRPWLFGAAALWIVMATVGQPAPYPVEAGRYEGVVTLVAEPRSGRYGPWALGEIAGTRVLLSASVIDASRGDDLIVDGLLDGKPGMAAGRPYGSTLDVARIDLVRPSDFWLHRAGEAVRGRVMTSLEPFDAGRGLLAGFLIGDTTHVSEPDQAAMRRSGLSHFVAVSGSNVILFLTLLAVLAGPLAWGPRRRAVVGLAGLPIYAAATGFEPSVMRASVMAASVLTGRLVGIVLESWQLLGLAVALLVVVDPALTSSVGFQLSVAATAGVLVGTRWPVSGKIRRALAVTVAAQVAVAPLILVHFGSVPLASPLVNLLAAPMVTVATALGAIGAMGFSPLIAPAELAAEMVLVLARSAAGLPQLQPLGLVAVLVVAMVLLRWPSTTTYLVVPVAIGVALLLLPLRFGLDGGEVAVLEVGQGDSILLSGGDGRYALVDGGPDGVLIMERLAEYGVTRLDLVVLTHVHADHVTGLLDVVAGMEVGQVWIGDGVHETESSRRFRSSLQQRGVPTTSPAPGMSYDLGDIDLHVEGPVRPYKSPNDESIVITAVGRSRTMLLAGDIEVVAQTDLAHLRADVLKVPHQGAATSSPDWLTGVGADEAVISVGPNQFGHPADWVIETLVASGAEVLRTDQLGNVVVNLNQ